MTTQQRAQSANRASKVERAYSKVLYSTSPAKNRVDWTRLELGCPRSRLYLFTPVFPDGSTAQRQHSDSEHENTNETSQLGNNRRINSGFASQRRQRLHINIGSSAPPPDAVLHRETEMG